MSELYMQYLISEEVKWIEFKMIWNAVGEIRT